MLLQSSSLLKLFQKSSFVFWQSLNVFNVCNINASTILGPFKTVSKVQRPPCIQCLQYKCFCSLWKVSNSWSTYSGDFSKSTKTTLCLLNLKRIFKSKVSQESRLLNQQWHLTNETPNRKPSKALKHLKPLVPQNNMYDPITSRRGAIKTSNWTNPIFRVSLIQLLANF